MGKWLLTYFKLEPSTVFKPMGTHTLTLTHNAFYKAEENFKEHAADPGTNNIAFFFENANGKELTVTGISSKREMILIDDKIFLRLNRREIKKSGKGKGYSYKDSNGRLVLVLQYVSDSQAHVYKATKALREYML